MEIEQLGPYRIVRQLGRGGMGTVYEGVNLDTGEPAAIKLLSAALARDEDFRERFEGEIETLRKLNHPNIVRLFGFGEQDRLLFYAMELVDGSSLETELQRGRRFDWREVTGIGIETCRALRHAHDRGVIHRDIKPGNLLLTGDGHVKLSDFGIARLFGNARLTSVGSVLGTAEYMAPEQAEGRPAGPRADLYSLGAVLYVLLARRPMFQAESLPDVLYKQRFEQPPPVSRHAPDVPAMLEAIIAQLLEKDPDRRIPNAAVLARQLEAMQQGLSLASDAGEAVTAENGVDSPGDPGDIHPAPSATDHDRPALGPLSPLRPPDASEPEPPPPVPPEPQPTVPQPAPPAADDLPETKVTSAFRNQDVADAAEEQKSGARFTLVPEEDLDRVEIEEARPPWISPQTWGLAAGLIAVGAAVWYFLQPPAPDALYEKITAQIDGGAIESLLQAEDGIEKFLKLYPTDSRARELRKYETEIALHHLEKKFERRAKGLAGTENLGPIQHAYLDAINYTRLNPELGMAKLQALIDLYNHRKDTSGPDGKCLELARRRLARLHEELDRQAAEHLALVQDRLDLADQLSRSEPRRAQAMYRAIIELYREKPWATEAVRRARDALDPTRDPE